MKRLFPLLFTFISVVVSGQIYDPVQWDFSQKKLSNNEIELQFKAILDEGWYLYSQNLDGDGPVATEFTFLDDNSYDLIGDVDEPITKEEYDPNFDMNLKYFKDEVIFTQKVKNKSNSDFTLSGNIYFMVCDNSQCLPPFRSSCETL